ncbi:MAG: OmpA family protein [Cyclobacteriaceae bacterium]
MRYSLLFVLLLAFGLCQAQGEHVGEKGYILKSIYFGGGSYYIDEVQVGELKHLVDSIPNLREYTITIHSHTDNIGGAAYNEWLSQMRSESVIQELLLSEFSLNQIQIKDFGQFNPVYDNSTWEGRFRNRRVDIIFWPIVF